MNRTGLAGEPQCSIRPPSRGGCSLLRPDLILPDSFAGGSWCLSSSEESRRPACTLSHSRSIYQAPTVCVCGLPSQVLQTQAECQPSSALLGFTCRGLGHLHNGPPRPLFLVAPVPQGCPAATFQIRYSSSRCGRLPRASRAVRSVRFQQKCPALPSCVGLATSLQVGDSKEPFFWAVPPRHPCSVQEDIVRVTNGFWPEREGFLIERIQGEGPAFLLSNISSSE